jgi:hypothetical protein
MIALMLLTGEDEYIRPNGRLPARPKYDKCILQAMCVGRHVLVSKATAEKLPKSITSVAKKVHIDSIQYGTGTSNAINLGVNTFATHKPDIIYIVRSTSTPGGGKVLRYREDYVREPNIVVCKTTVEVWRRK